MHYSILLPIWGIVALALYKVASMIVENRRHAAKAKEWGCQEPPMYPNCGFLGVKQVKRLLAADERKQFPDCLAEQQDTMNKFTGRTCSTYRQMLMGEVQYTTQDPENIKAMLATQFADYDLGPARRGNLMQTLGDGIFVQDGKPWEHSRAMLRPNFVREQVSDL